MNKLCIVIPLMGIALYPAALGLIPIDTYEWGFHGIGLPITLLLIMLLLLLTRATLLAGLMVTAALLASINAMESNNIWDYIIDPLLFIYTGFQLLKLTYNQQKRLNQ
ncbi:MAG: hypothetical protein IME93_03940 [Proteobacteria bacterium]|nr:hypothetical protein [Pseudomonadota bacterium]